MRIEEMYMKRIGFFNTYTYCSCREESRGDKSHFKNKCMSHLKYPHTLVKI